MTQVLPQASDHGNWTQSDKINTHLVRLFDMVNRRLARGWSASFIVPTLKEQQRAYERSASKVIGSASEQDRLLAKGVKYSDLELARLVLGGWMCAVEVAS